MEQSEKDRHEEERKESSQRQSEGAGNAMPSKETNPETTRNPDLKETEEKINEENQQRPMPGTL